MGVGGGGGAGISHALILIFTPISFICYMVEMSYEYLIISHDHMTGGGGGVIGIRSISALVKRTARQALECLLLMEITLFLLDFISFNCLFISTRADPFSIGCFSMGP